MKGILVTKYGPPEVMQYIDLPTPEPNDSQLLIKIHATGINPVETYQREGSQGYTPELPFTPGRHAAGIIAAMGKHVQGFSIGDRVFCNSTITGAYAEYALCSPDHAHALPEHISFSQGAALGSTYITAYIALFPRGRAVSGETVLIHGASGGVGTAAVQMAAAAGLNIIATAGTEQAKAMLMDLGAKTVVDHHDPEHFKHIMDYSKDGVDLILEMLANKNLEEDMSIVNNYGRIVIVGSRGQISIAPRRLMVKNASIIGILPGKEAANEFAQAYAYINKGIREGFLRPVIGKELSLQEAPVAHHLVRESRAYGKIVLIPERL
jgi:NADPH2:quinone reductase